MRWVRTAWFLVLAAILGAGIGLADTFPITGSFSVREDGNAFYLSLAFAGPSFSVNHDDFHEALGVDVIGFPAPGWSGSWANSQHVYEINEFGMPEETNGTLDGVSGTVAGEFEIQTAPFSVPHPAPNGYKVDNVPATFSGILSAYNDWPPPGHAGDGSKLWSVDFTGAGSIDMNLEAYRAGVIGPVGSVSGTISGTAVTGPMPGPSSFTVLFLVLIAGSMLALRMKIGPTIFQ